MNIEKYNFKSAATITDHADSPGILSGWVTRFGILSCDRGGYRDTFTASAFGNIESDDIRALCDHDWNQYLGRKANDTLTLTLTDDGLQFSLILPDTQIGRDTAALCRRGDIEGCSFGYLPDQFTWSDGDYLPIRQHTAGTLVEISVVYDPAFPETEVVLSSKTPASAETLASLQTYLDTKAKTPRLDRSKQLLKIAVI